MTDSARTSGFLKFCQEFEYEEGDEKFDPKTGRCKRAKRLEKAWRKCEKQSKYEKKSGKLPDPLPSKFRPDSNFGSVTETVEKMIENYKNGDDKFKEMIYTKFMHAMVDAGEIFFCRFCSILGSFTTKK